MKYKIILFYSILCIQYMLNLLSCNENKPSEPGPVTEKHFFYIGAESGGFVKVFSVEDQEFIDSLFFEDIPSDIMARFHVIGNDEKLAAISSAGTYIMDLKSKEIIESYDNVSMNFSPDSRYYLIDNAGRTSWDLRTYPSHETIYSDTQYPYMPRFSNDSRCLSYVHSLTENEVPQLRLLILFIEEDSLVIDKKYYNDDEIDIWFSHVVPGINKVFFWGTCWSGYFGCASNIGNDNTRIMLTLMTGSSTYPRVSPDDQYVYFTTTGSWDWPGPDIIYIYDTDTEKAVGEISLKGVFEPGVFTFTQNSKYMMVRSSLLLEKSKNVCLIDAKKFDIIGIFDFGQIPGDITTKFID